MIETRCVRILSYSSEDERFYTKKAADGDYVRLFLKNFSNDDKKPVVVEGVISEITDSTLVLTPLKAAVRVIEIANITGFELLYGRNSIH